MRIFLSGPMGAGKSTVARLCGARLGLPAIDLDHLIEEREGAAIGALFRERGEAGFRSAERAAAEALLGESGDAVVALGGGTVVDRAIRRRLLAAGSLVTLTAQPEALVGRVAGGGGRPLLADRDALSVVRELLAARADAYAECHAEIATDARSPESIAEEVLAVVREAPVVVPLGPRTYRIEIGAGIRSRVGARAGRAAGGEVALVVTDDNVAEPWAAETGRLLAAAGHRVAEARLPAGEAGKTIEAASAVWDAGLAAGIDRQGIVVAVGGGVVGDVAGFAASTLLRGIAIGQLPTTLLAMVDSSVGGKTGVNRSHGKNLVGTFHQPRFVLCDVETLRTLPARERTAGLAEVVKSAWLQGEEAVVAVERDAAALAGGDAEATARAIRMAVGLKARIVSEDEREAGPRMLLNLGHTLGHALEAASGYRTFLHGEAVSLGLVAALRIGVRLGRARPGDAARMERLLSAVGLPVDLDRHLDGRALSFVTADKKRAGDVVRFVVPGAPGATAMEPIAPESLATLLGR